MDGMEHHKLAIAFPEWWAADLEPLYLVDDVVVDHEVFMAAAQAIADGIA